MLIVSTFMRQFKELRPAALERNHCDSIWTRSVRQHMTRVAKNVTALRFSSPVFLPQRASHIGSMSIDRDVVQVIAHCQHTAFARFPHRDPTLNGVALRSLLIPSIRRRFSTDFGSSESARNSVSSIHAAQRRHGGGARARCIRGADGRYDAISRGSYPGFRPSV
jgi:hypothetical protein